jgi:DNA mismatch repair protein MutL
VLSSDSSFEASQDLHNTPLGKIIGQSHNSYIILETSDGIKMLDQHAVAERVIYERISRKSYTPVVQQLLVAEIYSLTPSEHSTIQESKEIFQDMGFDIEELSANSISINGVPDFIKKENIQRIFLGILEDIGG